MSLPNAFLMGAPRAGTTSLYYYLKRHPQIYFPPVKEPGYFIQDGKIKDISKYCDLYEGAESVKIRGDASTMYFYSKNSLHKIKRKVSNPYIIIQLRDPVERAISQYRLRRTDGRENRRFLEACQREYDNIESDEVTEVNGYVYRGLYGIHISNIKSVFGAKKLKVTFFKNFSDAEKQIVKDITNFMGLTPISLDEKKVYNRSTKQKYSFLKKAMVKAGLKKLAKKLTNRDQYQKIKSYFMYEINESDDYVDIGVTENEKKEIYKKFFKDDIKKLENIIGKSLDEWKR